MKDPLATQDKGLLKEIVATAVRVSGKKHSIYGKYNSWSKLENCIGRESISWQSFPQCIGSWKEAVQMELLSY